MLRPLPVSPTLLAALLLLMLAGCRTPKVDRTARMYAYIRTVMPGMIPDRNTSVDRINGEPADRSVENYFIYLSKPDPSISNLTIWISGKAYQATQQEITQLPIVLESGGPGIFKITDTLVPAGTAHVWRIIPGDPSEATAPRILKNQDRQPAVVLEFMHNGKHLFVFSNTFKKLTPIVLE